MGPVQLASVMDEIAARMGVWGDYEQALFPRAYGWPNPSVNPPSLVVAFPPLVEFDATFTRGMDRITDLPVWAVFGGPDTLSGRNNVIDDCLSVKERIEAAGAPDPEARAWTSARVKTVAFTKISNDDGTEFMAAQFTVDVVT